MVRLSVEYPAVPSTVDYIGVVGFILSLQGQAFSLNLCGPKLFYASTRRPAEMVLILDLLLS
jgi:hypothetical protein